MHTMAQLELAMSYQQLSDYEQAAGMFQGIARDARGRGDFISELLGISARARLVLQQGKLHQAFQIAQEGLERMETTGKFTPFSATLFGEIGQIYYQWHRLDLADEYSLRSVQTSGHSGYIDPEMYYHIVRSKIRLMEGDWAAAEKEMEKVAELMHISPPAMIRESILAQQIRVDLAFERYRQVQAALEGEGFRFDQESGLPGLPSGSDFAIPAGLLHNSALRYVLCLARSGHSSVDLNRLIEMAGFVFDNLYQHQQIPMAIEALLLRSQMYAAEGDEAHSLADMGRAVELAQPEGFISVFVEEGLAATESLTVLAKQNSPGSTQQRFIQEILAAFPGLQAPEKQLDRSPVLEGRAGINDREGAQVLVEALSNREMEVLRLIARGDSNQTIAEKLVITVSAVKKHTANIYGKLAVNSRTQAIARARQLGLLQADS